jgi:hypothetical protein
LSGAGTSGAVFFAFSIRFTLPAPSGNEESPSTSGRSGFLGIF